MLMRNNTIRIDEENSIWRGTKLIGWVEDGDINLAHGAYKRHLDEIELIMDQSEPSTQKKTAPEQSFAEDSANPKTPAHLLLEGEGAWYGEGNPPVVEWRKKNWGAKAFDDKYGHQTELLKEIYLKHDMIYDRDNSNN